MGRLLNVRQIGTIGGDYQKWTLANIDKTILDKKVANLSDEELRDFRQVIDETSVCNRCSLRHRHLMSMLLLAGLAINT